MPPWLTQLDCDNETQKDLDRLGEAGPLLCDTLQQTNQYSFEPYVSWQRRQGVTWQNVWQGGCGCGARVWGSARWLLSCARDVRWQGNVVALRLRRESECREHRISFPEGQRDF